MRKIGIFCLIIAGENTITDIFYRFDWTDQLGHIFEHKMWNNIFIFLLLFQMVYCCFNSWILGNISSKFNLMAFCSFIKQRNFILREIWCILMYMEKIWIHINSFVLKIAKIISVNAHKRGLFFLLFITIMYSFQWNFSH